MTKAEFDKINFAHEENLRRDPFGTEARRKEVEALRKSFEEFMAQIKAAKKKGQQ